VICAGRALADCTEDEIGRHHASLERVASTPSQSATDLAASFIPGSVTKF
jgi:hypothetical protein